MAIKTFDDALYLHSSNQITISETNITDSTDGILVSDSSNNCVYENNIAGNAYEGIYILTSSNNTISENNITVNTGDGVYLWGSSNNTIVGNNISNNWWGVASYYSSNNRIFHNNFINNPSQASSESSVDIWDDDYPSGGNYWSDYTGVDEKSGPYQDQPGSDGIGDTPYVIDANNRDRYPFMAQYYLRHDITVTAVAPSKTVVGQGFTVQINVTIANQGDYPELLNMTLYANTTTITTFTRKTLLNGISVTINLTWNTSGFAKGNYTIWAYAEPVQGETDTADNRKEDGWIVISIYCDINGDGIVDISDILDTALAFGSTPGQPRWNPNCDLDDNGIIDISDILEIALHFGQT
jgi:parallel beta-helix repeat protein